MSKITNTSNLPESLVAAVTHSDRDREGCDYTITELLTPPRILALKHLHDAEIEEDAADRLWALLGQAGHEVLRRAGKGQGKAIVEERAVIEVTLAGRTYKIGGQLDYLQVTNAELTDFKFTSVWAIKDGIKPDWEQQLNLYRWLAWHYGVTVDKLQIVAILRDWSVREAGRDPDYPQTQAQTFEVRLWTWDQCETFTTARIAMHEAAKLILPECSSADMWEKPAKFAVMKNGQKRAVKLHTSEEEADSHAAHIGGRVEYRPGERPRCESYCNVAKFCLSYQNWKGAQAKT